MCFTILMILLFSTFLLKRLGYDINDEQSSRKEFVSYILLIFHLENQVFILMMGIDKTYNLYLLNN